MRSDLIATDVGLYKITKVYMWSVTIAHIVICSAQISTTFRQSRLHPRSLYNVARLLIDTCIDSSFLTAPCPTLHRLQTLQVLTEYQALEPVENKTVDTLLVMKVYACLHSERPPQTSHARTHKILLLLLLLLLV